MSIKIVTRGYYAEDPGDMRRDAKPMNVILTTNRNFEFNSYHDQMRFERFLERALMITSKSKKIKIVTLEVQDNIDAELKNSG